MTDLELRITYHVRPQPASCEHLRRGSNAAIGKARVNLPADSAVPNEVTGYLGPLTSREIRPALEWRPG